MSIISNLTVHDSYYTVDILESKLKQIDSVQNRRECDYLCFGTNSQHALGRKLKQKFNVVQLKAFHDQVNAEVPSIEAKLRAQHRRNVLIQLVISIAGVITGACLLKNSTLDTSSGAAGMIVTVLSASNLLVLLLHCRGRIEAKISGLQNTLIALGEVFGHAKAQYGETDVKTSKSLKDWYKDFCAVHFDGKPSAAKTTVQVQIVVDSRMPLLSEGTAAGQKS
jgi:hypothetical protein